MERAHVEAALYGLASVGNLFIALFVALRARRAAGALPIALLSLALFLWDSGECLHRLSSGEPRWKYLALVGSSLAPAFLTHFAVVFCRRTATLGRWVALAYAVTAPFTLSTAGALLGAPTRPFVDSWAWNGAYVVALFPFLVLSLAVVHRRRREVEAREERNALNFVAAGIAIGAATGLIDLLHLRPSVGHAGSLVCTIILSVAILRHRLLESETPLRRALLILGVAASAVGLNMALHLQGRPEGGPALLGIGVVTAAGFAVYRMLLLDWYEQAERRRRLALVGTLAAGVAHEIRNPLGSIKGAAQVAMRELEGRDGVGGAREYLALLTGEVDRLNAVVEEFLSFARPRAPRMREVRLNGLVESVLRLEETAVPAGIRIVREADASDPAVRADPELLRQALLNVVRNAVEACGAAGTVTVRTKRVAGRRPSAVLEVEDTGPGIGEEARSRLFQPFHTTKARGTGLGLAIAARVAEAHGGAIDAVNAPSGGARFSFTLPERPL